MIKDICCKRYFPKGKPLKYIYDCYCYRWDN